MVQLNKLKKADLTRMGFVGPVSDMKKELSKIVKGRGINTRNINVENLTKKVKSVFRARALTKGRRIERSKALSCERRARRISEARESRRRANAPVWIVTV